MKVELNNNEKSFKPISFNVTIESKDELDMLIIMHAKNCSIPDMMKSEHRDLCYKYLKHIYTILNNI
mgnify:CR=1 FL=1